MSNISLWSQPTEWVTPYIIQEMFNENQFYEKVLRGELRQRIFRYDNHLKPKQRRKLTEPRCTRSQIVLYSTPEGKPVAIVHQYRRPNGELGGRGKPDPKRLFVSYKVIAVRESP